MPSTIKSIVLLMALGLVGSLFAQQPTGNQTRRAESFPAYSPDGESLYFSLADHPRNLGQDNAADIWVVTRQADGSWSKPIICGAPINTFGVDRVVGMGAGGDKLAVLRLGAHPYIDILAKGVRVWRITHSWPLDRQIARLGFPHFDLENWRLFFQDTAGDLYTRQAKTGGEWSASEPLRSLNSEAREERPYLAQDGKTFYFKRDDRWMYAKLQEGEELTTGPPQLILEWQGVQIESFSFAVASPQRLVICGLEEGGQTKVRTVPIPGRAAPELCRVLSGKVQLPPGQGTSDAQVTLLVDGKSRQVDVDAYGNYALIVEENAEGQVVADAPGYFAPARGIGSSIASEAYAASSDETVATDEASLARKATIQDLNNRIYRSQEALNELRVRRQQADVEWRKQLAAAGEDVLANYIDPELEALRFREANARAALTDTLPPRPIRPAVSDSLQRAIDSVRYAELEEMRARFQHFQDDELARRGQSAHEWENTTAQPPNRELVARTIEQDWAPAAAQEVLEETDIDRESLATDVSRDLFPSSAPAVYERQAWENELLSGVRPQAQAQLRENLREPLESQIRERDQIARQTNQYEIEIERLNDSLDLVIAAQLQAEQSASPTTALPPGRDLRAKTVPQPTSYQTTPPPAPISYSAPIAVDFIPLEAGRKTILEQVTFQPGSAYLDIGADSELQRLLSLLQNQPQLKLMLGVHMGSNYSFSDAQAISQGRKSTLSAWFTERGIRPDRVAIEAYGRSRPLPVNAGSNSGDERVELIIR